MSEKVYRCGCYISKKLNKFFTENPVHILYIPILVFASIFLIMTYLVWEAGKLFTPEAIAGMIRLSPCIYNLRIGDRMGEIICWYCGRVVPHLKIHETKRCPYCSGKINYCDSCGEWLE